MNHASHKLRLMIRSAAIQEILKAAESLLREGEQHPLSMSRVAQRAGCAVGTLYGYFPSRQALLQGVVESVVRGGLLQEKTNGSDGLPTPARLWRYLHQCAAWASVNATLLRRIGCSGNSGGRECVTLHEALSAPDMPLLRMMHAPGAGGPCALRFRAACASALLETMLYACVRDEATSRETVMETAWSALVTILNRPGLPGETDGLGGMVLGEIPGQGAGPS
jgi:AcrR family transcriptional regulator